MNENTHLVDGDSDNDYKYRLADMGEIRWHPSNNLVKVLIDDKDKYSAFLGNNAMKKIPTDIFMLYFYRSGFTLAEEYMHKQDIINVAYNNLSKYNSSITMNDIKRLINIQDKKMDEEIKCKDKEEEIRQKTIENIMDIPNNYKGIKIVVDGKEKGFTNIIDAQYLNKKLKSFIKSKEKKYPDLNKWLNEDYSLLAKLMNEKDQYRAKEQKYPIMVLYKAVLEQYSRLKPFERENVILSECIRFFIKHSKHNRKIRTHLPNSFSDYSVISITHNGGIKEELCPLFCYANTNSKDGRCWKIEALEKSNNIKTIYLKDIIEYELIQ